MRTNKILNIMMSAAVMASVASGTVLAEETEEETIEYREMNETEGQAEKEHVLEQKKGKEIGPGAEYGGCESNEGDAAQETEEAVYVRMGTVEELNGPETAAKAEQQKEEPESIKPQEYGPHMDLLAKETEAEETPPLYTDEDLYILAHAICGEGQCCPDEEQLYIGSVILNRRSHGAYPNTIQGVVFQRGQYACTWDGNYYREPTEANWRNARWLLENGSVLPENVVYQAGFRQGSGIYLQTRYHKYCYR